ncbi:MAG: hypothetical protein O7F71_19060 [Gammaproteobacteria bacterium]|nr:hypothetical protein [Gammaproteobacteria bacterium]
MLKRVDRIQLTTHNAQAVADRWMKLLDATAHGADEVPALNATRVTIQVGDSLVEILQPTGPGFAEKHLAAGRGGPFSIGVSCENIDNLRAHLKTQNIQGLELADQLFLHESHIGIPGLNVVVSPHVQRDQVGLLSNLYEATHLTADANQSAADIARVFALDAEAFVKIDSDTYGYEGSLTLFDASRLHRIETIHPFDAAKTMGRYREKFGSSMYMCYGETDDLPVLRERLKDLAPDDWTGSDDNHDGLFINPRALGGVMVGVSRTSYAWTWSGYPERVVSIGS